MVTVGDAPVTVASPSRQEGVVSDLNAIYDTASIERARASSLPVVQDANQISLRRRICKSCEHNKAGRCGIIAAAGRAGELEHPLGIPNHRSWCPLPEPKFGPIVLPKAIHSSHGTYVTRQRLTDDIQHLFTMLFSAVPNIKGIVGVPRSGMAVASQLAMLSGLPLYAVTKTGIVNVGHGQRLSGTKGVIEGPLALVEDSVASGRSMRAAKIRCKREDIVTCSVYATSKGMAEVDVCAVSLELPYYLEWHIFGSTLIPAWRFGIDFDGILCRDCLPGEDDGGTNYLRFLKTVPPLRLPRPHTVPAIITARIEKYRPQTEQWLARHGIKFDKLIMGPWASRRERNGNDVGAWKAEQVKANGIKYFIESDARQAKTIADNAGITVICPASETVYKPQDTKFTDHKEPPLPATRELAVITIACGHQSLDILDITRPSVQRYAEACGADYHEITNDLVPSYPIGNKFRLKNLVANYKRVLFVDCDLWIRKDTPNLFEVVPEGTVGIHRDYEHITDKAWLAGEGELAAKEQQVDPIKIRCLNTGVVVFDTSFSGMWDHPPLPCPTRHLSEQTWVEFNIVHQKIPVTTIDVKFNTQWWFKDFSEREPSAHIVHLANCPHEERIYRFRKLAWQEIRQRPMISIAQPSELDWGDPRK